MTFEFELNERCVSFNNGYENFIVLRKKKECIPYTFSFGKSVLSLVRFEWLTFSRNSVECCVPSEAVGAIWNRVAI